MINNISITGLTPLDYYPEKCSIKNCKQNIKSINLYIPCQKPDMESINEIKVNFCIDKYKILKTILGIKLFITLTANIKVIYTALNEEQSLHSAHWDISFCDFILLKNFYPDNCTKCNPNLFIGLEDVCVSYCDSKSIDLFLLYTICSDFNYNDCSDNCDCAKEKIIFTPDLTSNKNNSCNNYYCPVEYYHDSPDIDAKDLFF